MSLAQIVLRGSGTCHLGASYEQNTRYSHEFEQDGCFMTHINEGGFRRPHQSKDLLVLLGRDHRDDLQRAGIHDEDFFADHDVFIVAIFREGLHELKRQPVEMNGSRNGFSD